MSYSCTVYLGCEKNAAALDAEVGCRPLQVFTYVRLAISDADRKIQRGVWAGRDASAARVKRVPKACSRKKPTFQVHRRIYGTDLLLWPSFWPVFARVCARIAALNLLTGPERP